MYSLACTNCLGALPGVAMTARAIQESLAKLGYGDTGAVGTWNTALKAAIKKFQEKEGYTYATGKPEYSTVFYLIEQTVGAPAFWEWADLYQQATGSRPNELTFNIQWALRKLEYDPGPIDGLMGTKTAAGIKAWQKVSGYAVTGVLTAVQNTALMAAAAAAPQPMGMGFVTADPPAVAQAVAAAEAAGVPVIVTEDPGVSAPKIIITRDPATQAVIRVEKLVPVPKKLIPWLWIGLGTAAVLGVGGVVALIVRAQKKPAAAMGDPALTVREHEQKLKRAESNAARATRAGYRGKALAWAKEIAFQKQQIRWHQEHPRGY